MRLLLPILAAIVLLVAVACAPEPPPVVEEPSAPGVSERLPWHGEGVWLHGDTHIHNLMSLKKGPPIATAAASSGLDFFATTEHAQSAIKATTKSTLDQMRRKYPDVIILAGIEWNMPGAHHANVIVEQSEEEWSLLEQFVDRYDRKVHVDLKELEPEEGDHTWGTLEYGHEAIGWLRQQAEQGGPRSAVFLNHPSRHRFVTDAQINEMQAAGLHGVEGAPGHQLREPPGYPDDIDRVDRHEPYLAVVGGGYDRLLADGRNMSIVAGSDFHITETAYYPGFYQRSLVYAPERTPEGVILGLQAGCTATIMGKIVRSVDTKTTYEGLDDHAMIAEVLNVPRGKRVIYTVELDVPQLDANRERNHVDRVEIISDWRGKPEIVKTFEEIGLGEITLEYALPAEATSERGRFYLRARGRRIVGDERNDLANADILFYTGGTRVRVIG